MTKVLELRNICKSFQNQPILHDINFEIYSGEFVTLLGPSGCGKTTLIQLINGLLQADSGEVWINESSVTSTPPQRRQVHTVFQNYALFPHLNVFDNIAFSLRMKKLPIDLIQVKSMDLLEKLELTHLMYHMPDMLSGGQQQRVAIARCVINEPVLLLLDEPFSSLDVLIKKKTSAELKRLQKMLNISFLLITHDHTEALAVSDRIIVIRNGEIQQIGTAKEIYTMPSNIWVAQFIGEANIIAVHDAIDMKINLPVDHDIFAFLHIRPEHVHVALNSSQSSIRGVVSEVIYHGATVNIMIILDCHILICARQFTHHIAPEILEVGTAVYLKFEITKMNFLLT